ncbi:hypothetical protein [Pelagovum pacificum]|uniref:Lipoprotein n=1 Tax=Pelagovum pacificum TaxID=2588711 RepID=A0A5C5GF73_9RHOB|nr:hypothetical protein [Pelagovum pacificum]QQA43687.1 hypothetical protein I8N54_03670 [Pelagovum pacificum]TNY33180.1 hypothetical protein FHY64_07860 [Pelagovum pacificum]
MTRFLPLAALAFLASCNTGPELVPLGVSGGASRTDTIYRTEFVGRFSPSPICQGQELQIEFAPESVYLGETGCNIAGTRRISNGVALELVGCRAEGAAQADRTLSVTRAGSGALQVSGGGVDSTVQPCLD